MVDGCVTENLVQPVEDGNRPLLTLDDTVVGASGQPLASDLRAILEVQATTQAT